MRVQPGTANTDFGEPPTAARSRFRHRRRVAQVLAGLVVAGMGLPMVSGAAQAAPAQPDLAGPHSAVGKSPRAEADQKLGRKDFRIAAGEAVTAKAYGVSASVSLLGMAAIGTNETPVAVYPGDGSETTANVGVRGLLTTGAVTTTADGDDLRNTSSAAASVAGLGTGTGLQGLQAVTADVVGSTCTGNGAGVTATTTVTGLKLAGVANTTIPTNPAPNTSLNLAGLGTLHLNEQVTTTSGGKTKLVTNALRLELLGGALSAVGQGSVIAGHTECTATNAITPVVTGALNPTGGPETGGTTVTLTGTNFIGATDVRFGAKPAQYTIVSPTSITATSPDGTGPVSVQVINSAGTGTAPGQFTYAPPPAVASINPSNGPPAGGTVVTITGSGFTNASTVRFGTTAATNVTYNSATSLTATSPAGTGTVDVRVTTAGFTSATNAGTNFTYLGAPTLSSLSPTSGSTTGGTTVTVTGTNFTPAAVVTVGGVDQPTTYVSATELTFVADAHAAGTVNVGVARGSLSSGTQTFTYVNAAVSGLTPNNGPITGGTSVVAAGTNLDLVTGVTVDGTAAVITAQPANGSSLTFVAPPHLASGSVSVVFTGPGTATTTTSYTYNALAVPVVGAPVILSMTPTSGPMTGALDVTITGTSLDTVTAVDFGGTPGIVGLSNLAGTSLVVTPPTVTTPGPVTVTLTNPSGSNIISLDSTYTFVAAAPTVGSISPDSGPVTGGTDVTVTGTNFVQSSVVVVNGTAVPTTYVDPTHLTFTTPPGATTLNVQVQTASVTSVQTVTFTYAVVPLNAVALPLSGPVSGGTPVTITGVGFDDVDSVTIGGNTVPSAGLTINGANTQITFSTPAHAAGAVTMSLGGDFGTSLLPSSFIYTAAAPTVSAINPITGPLAGGYNVTLTGTGFVAPVTIRVGATSVPAGDITVNSGTSITFRMPVGLVDGSATVVVTTAGGTDSIPFTYQAPPTVSSLVPISGTAAGGTEVTITGTGFTGATSVTFGGTAGTGLTVVNATTIRVTTPAHATGAVPVSVVGVGGGSTNLALYTYVPITVAPTVTALNPGVGPVTGGTAVTISGTGFALTSGVTFGGTTATFTVINDNTLIATSPANAAGSVGIVVTNLVGSSASVAASQFTYVAPNTSPVVDSITPASGPVAGGTRLVIRGLNLTGTTQVTFAGTAGADLTVVDNTTLTVTTPAHAAGAVPVVLTNAQGASASYVYTYVPLSQLPTVSSLTPNVGPVAGGTRVTLSGTGFDQNTTVTFDGVAGTGLVLGPDVDNPSGASLKSARTRDNDLRVRSFAKAGAKKALNRWKAAVSNTLTVLTPPHAGGPTTVVVTNSAGSMSFVESFTFIPVLAATATIETDVVAGASKTIAPKGPGYSGLEVSACSTPQGLGSTAIPASGKACVYSASDTLGTDSFVMSVIDDLGQTSEQTVDVTIVADSGSGSGSGSGGGTGGGGGNDTGDGDGSGSGGGGGNDSGNGDGSGNGSGNGSGSGSGGAGGNDTGGGLAFTGTPLLLIPGLALGLILVLIGGGLLGAEKIRIRRRGNAVQPTTGQDGRRLMPAGRFGPEASDPELDQQDGPDDAA